MPGSHHALTSGAPVPSLVPSGLSPDADLIYRTMVTFGPDTGTGLQRALGLSRRRIRSGLDELAAAGAAGCRAAGDRRSTVWTARPLEEVMAARRRARPRRVRSGTQVPPEPLRLGDDLRHLPSRATARARMAELVAVATYEHLAMHNEPRFDAEASRSAAPMDRRLLARGVRMRVLGVQPADPGWPESAAPRAGPRPDYREAPAVPTKLIVVDRRIALVPVVPDDLGRGYLEVAQPPVVSALVALFERHWESAQAPQEYAVPDIALDPRERALITLLAQGHTDATAARELRISARSVSYILRGLMDRLGVENRFQLGLALGAMRAARPTSQPDAEPQPQPSTPEEPEPRTNAAHDMKEKQ